VISSKITVRSIRGKGRGVVARMAIRSGATLERSPYLGLTEVETEALESTALKFYHYDLMGANGSAIGLGYASLYNHAEDPNADFAVLESKGLIVVKAIRSIRPGQEITIHYGWNHEHFKQAGFKPK
jgi:SET domain-containing protein